MSAKLLCKKLFFRLNQNLFGLKESKTYSLSNRLFCYLNRDPNKTIKTNIKLVRNKYLYIHSPIGLNVNNNRNSLELIKRNLSQNKDKEDENDENDKSLSKVRPLLMQFEPKLWPNIWYQWKNFVLTYTIIKPYFDNEFSLDKFMVGSRQVSHYSILSSSHSFIPYL